MDQPWILPSWMAAARAARAPAGSCPPVGDPTTQRQGAPRLSRACRGWIRGQGDPGWLRSPLSDRVDRAPSHL